ncbi:MAG: efflux RND transporter periplasmic adaptor subunit [Bacteroidota bacterium]|nr:efflux RND transporter periplasmic adaptor subunit [Bacteroidota bacterium]
MKKKTLIIKRYCPGKNSANPLKHFDGKCHGPLPWERGWSEALQAGRIFHIFSWTTIIIKTFLLLSFALGLMLFMGCKNHNKNKVGAATETEEIYSCSMHPQIIEHAPGRCPICGMTLVKKENAAREISKVDLSTLLEPVNNTVLSSVPVTSVKFEKQQLRLNALGTVEYDTRFMKTISARVSGRINKLYIKYRFQPVRAGEKIMELYSPELLTAQQNLLFLIKNDPENKPLIDAAKQRLLLLGMHESDLQRMITNGNAQPNVTVYSNYTGHIHEAGQKGYSPEPVSFPTETPELTVKEGMYIDRGQPVFQVNNMDHVWISLNLFPGDNSLVKVGTPVTIITETEPGKKIKGKINFIEPFYRDNSKTVTARVYLDNSALMIPVGSQVTATVDVNSTSGNWLPESAVLSLGLDKVVFLKEGKVFKVKPVTTGITANNLIQITAGLNAKDSVAANAQFLVDSEGFIKVKK